MGHQTESQNNTCSWVGTVDFRNGVVRMIVCVFDIHLKCFAMFILFSWVLWKMGLRIRLPVPSRRVVLIIMILIFVCRKSLLRISVNKWRILFAIAFQFGYRRSFGAANNEIDPTTETQAKNNNNLQNYKINKNETKSVPKEFIAPNKWFWELFSEYSNCKHFVDFIFSPILRCKRSILYVYKYWQDYFAPF